MNDLTASPGISTVSSRGQIALLVRFNTTAAGFIATGPAGAPVGSLVPVESALRAFATGNGLPGNNWLGAGLNAVTLTATLPPAAYWTAELAEQVSPPRPPPGSVR